MRRRRIRQKYIKGNFIEMKIRIMALLIVFSFISSGHIIQAKSRLTTFRQYKLSVGAGLGFSPMSIFSPTPYSYSPFTKNKPALKLEFSIHPKYTLNIGYQLEHYKFQTKGKTQFFTIGGEREKELRDIGIRALNTATTIDFRKYTTGVGYIAPYGRFVMYGLSLNRYQLRNDEFSFSEKVAGNESLVYTFPKQKQIIKVTGIRFGLGKKRYMQKSLKTFLEYQVIMDLKLGDFGVGLKDEDQSIYNEIMRNAYEKALRLSQVSSILQFNIRYGFSF